MSKLRRPFLYDRYIFVTVNLLRSRRKLEERDFGRLAISLARMRQKQRFALTAWVFLPDHWHAIIYPPHPLSIANAMSDRSADVRPWRLHCNAVGSCFFSKDLQALRRAERRSAQGQRRWPLHAGWRGAQLCDPQTRLKSGEPIHTQNRRIVEVARTCFVGPRLFVVNWGRTADLQNRSALHSRLVPQARDPAKRPREFEAEGRRLSKQVRGCAT